MGFRPETLGLQVTYRCNVRCKHCGPCCGPDQHDEMSLGEMKDLVAQASELGLKVIAFTGGEPTLLGDKLLEILNFTRRECGIKITKLVTNGSWATTYQQARKKLLEWQKAGLVEIRISCGEFHQQEIPLQNVLNAYRAACDLNYPSVLLAGEFLKEGAGNFSIQSFLKTFDVNPYFSNLQSPYVSQPRGLVCGAAMRFGRGLTNISSDDVVDQPEHAINGPCSEVFAAFTAHPTGHLTACCGVMVREESFLNVGNWRDGTLRSIWETAQQDLILNWIKYLGLSDLKKWLIQKDPGLRLRDSYASACDLCSELLYNAKCQDLLLRYGHERTDDVLANRVAVETAGIFDQECGTDI